MDNVFEKYNYNLEFNRYDDSPYYVADELIRDCLHDISEEQLIIDLKKVKRQFDMYSTSNQDILPALYYIMSAVLYQKNNKQCLSIISERFNEETDFKEWQLYQTYSINTCSRLTLLFVLTLFLLRKTDDELCKRLIDRWIAIQDGESREHYWSDDKVVHVEFIVSPLYPLMITENFELIKYFLEKTAQTRDLTKAELAKTLNLEGYVESAVEYYQEEFLDLLCDYGFDFSNNMAALTYIYSNQQNFDYISQVWDVRKEIVPLAEFHDDNSARKRICIPWENQLAFLMKMFRNYGMEVCDRVFNCLSPIVTIHEKDFSKLIYGRCIGDSFDCKSLDNVPSYNGIRYDVNTVALLDRYVSENITIIADSGKIDEYPPYLLNKKVTFDMRKCDGESKYCGLQYCSVSYIKSLLRNSDILFNTDELTDFHRELLKRNSAAVAKLMIKKGAFSDANVGEAISYLVENKLYNCLAELNKMYFKEDKV